MASIFAKPASPSLSDHHKPLSWRFSPTVSVRLRRRPDAGTLRARAALIEPDGGKLVDLRVEPARKDEKRHEAASLPRVKLSRIDLEWVHVLSEGWASPLSGFMRESEFLQTLHFNSLRLEDGSVVNMSVPIVLAVGDPEKQRIGDSNKVALVSPDGNTVAILRE